jgi:hypothetical protein
MFTMMNNARLAVGVQGVAIAERAYQQALAYARERRQGRAIGAPETAATAAIIQHPDLRRLLMTMKAKTEAARALAYLAAASLDRASAAPDSAARLAANTRFALLTPLTKAWCTAVGCAVADLGIQVHGGMGFIEETGAAQHYRDARILPIYEGTNGIQALDLMGRKLLHDKGAAVRDLTAEIEATVGELSSLAGSGPAMAAALETALADHSKATDWLLETGKRDLALAAAGASPYCDLFGTLLGGWLLARSALAAAARLAAGSDADRSFLEAKIKTALFYAENILPQCSGLARAVTQGAESTLALDEEQF